MEANTLISAIMTKKVIVADLQTKFSDIMTLFLDYRIYHLPVVENDVLIGIVSLTDALRFFRKEANNITKDEHLNEIFDINVMMTTNPSTLGPDNTVKDAAEILSQAKFRSLPIVNEADGIVGIVSNKDLVKVLNKVI
ncbi:MAG: CBS domain-containing protein [Planctomycetota bacterium]|jgi:CBS domain-containing protein